MHLCEYCCVTKVFLACVCHVSKASGAPRYHTDSSGTCHTDASGTYHTDASETYHTDALGTYHTDARAHIAPMPRVRTTPTNGT